MPLIPLSKFQTTIMSAKKHLIILMSYVLPTSALCMLNRILAQNTTSQLKNIIGIIRAIKVLKSLRRIRQIRMAHGLDNLTSPKNTTESPLRNFTSFTGLMAVHNLERQRKSAGNGSEISQGIGSMQ